MNYGDERILRIVSFVRFFLARVISFQFLNILLSFPRIDPFYYIETVCFSHDIFSKCVLIMDMTETNDTKSFIVKYFIYIDLTCATGLK